MGDNLIKKSEKMPWWTGNEVKTLDDRTVKVETLLNALNDMAVVPERKVRGAGGAQGDCGLGACGARQPPDPPAPTRLTLLPPPRPAPPPPPLDRRPPARAHLGRVQDQGRG
jgi:hypothetical protein